MENNKRREQSLLIIEVFFGRRIRGEARLATGIRYKTALVQLFGLTLASAEERAFPRLTSEVILAKGKAVHSCHVCDEAKRGPTGMELDLWCQGRGGSRALW